MSKPFWGQFGIQGQQKQSLYQPQLPPLESCSRREKSLLEKVQDLLKSSPKSYDVTFSVGPQKKEVKALRILLKAASPVLRREFEQKWELAVMKDGLGIPLPHLDPDAFQLFVELTMLDKWESSHLEQLHLPPNQVLNLIGICNRFGMEGASKDLQKMAKSIFQSFHNFKDTKDFLLMSQANLTTVLSSDELSMEEPEVFKAALRWGEHQCGVKGMMVTGENIRHSLGPCLFEIRFPLMSTTQFTQVLKTKNLLTAQEALEIYQYIGREVTMETEEYDALGGTQPFQSNLAFKVQHRKNKLQDFINPNSWIPPPVRHLPRKAL